MAADGQHPDATALIADALDGIGQGVLIVDADGCMVRGNRRFLDLYGVGEFEWPGIQAGSLGDASQHVSYVVW